MARRPSRRRKFPHDRLGIRQVSKRQKWCCMRMVDELVWKERMKQRLHRGVRRRRIKQISALNVDHFLIRQPVKALEFKQPVKTDRRQSRCLYCSPDPTPILLRKEHQSCYREDRWSQICRKYCRHHASRGLAAVRSAATYKL